jgi:hypothetical protein
MELALWEPNVLEVDFHFDPVHGRPDFTQSGGNVNKQLTWSALKDNFLIDASVEIQEFDILRNLKVDFFGV